MAILDRGQVIAGPFLREVGPTAVTVWFATAEPLASPPRLEIWNPAPSGYLTAPEPSGGTTLSGTPRYDAAPVLEQLWVHTVRVTFRTPLPRGRVLAYRLRLTSGVVACPGTFQRVVAPPGGSATVTFATFVVPRRRDLWMLGVRAASSLQVVRVAAEIERQIVPSGRSRGGPPPVAIGPTRLVVFGAPFPQEPSAFSLSAVERGYLELAKARLGRVLGLWNERTEALTRRVAGYLLAWSPAVFERYLPAGAVVDNARVAVTAFARLMANVCTEIVGAPELASEASAERTTRRYVLPSLQRAARLGEPPSPVRPVASRPVQLVIDEGVGGLAEALAADDTSSAAIVSVEPLLTPAPAKAIAPEIARRDHTFVMCLSSGPGYIAFTPPRSGDADAFATTPRGGYYEVGLPRPGGSAPSVSAPLELVRGEGDGFVSIRRAGQRMVLSLHASATIAREIELAAARLQAQPDQTGMILRSPSLPADDEKRLLASLRIELASEPASGPSRVVATGSCSPDGIVRLDTTRVDDGAFSLRVGADGAGARARGSPGHVWKRKLFEVEVEDRTISAIEDEPIPGPGYLLALEPSYQRVARMVGTASGSGKWGATLGPSGTHTTGNAITPLVDGVDTLAAMSDAIKRATGDGHFIYLLAWWFDVTLPLTPGGPSVGLMLKTAAEAGVQVRVILFQFPGVSWQIVNHIAIARLINEWPDAAAFVDRLTARYVGGHHQKMLVVNGGDGLTAFCGGIDINRDRVEHDKPGQPLHDVHARVRGPAANDLLDVFITRWLHHPEHRRVEGPTKRPLLPLSRTIPRVIRGPARARAVETFNVVHEYWRRACKDRRTYHAALFAAIAAAQHTIYIEDQYLVHVGVADALSSARARGLRIIILLPSNALSDLQQARQRRQIFLDHLGIGAANAERVGAFERRGEVHSYVHAKMSTFDDELAIIGSANLNRRGLSSDSEVGIVFEDPPTVKALRKQLWCEHLACTPADVDDLTTGGALWWSPPGGAHVAPFDRTKSEATYKSERLESFRIVEGLVRERRSGADRTWDAIWDPDAEDLPECSRAEPQELREIVPDPAELRNR